MNEELIDKIDSAIVKVADDISDGGIADNFLADTVKALTGLIAIRTQLY